MWIELNRRCDTDMGDHEDVELNPCQIDTFVAELVGQEDGRTLYCTACWTPFMPQVYSFSVTDESVYGWIVDYERGGQRPAGRHPGPGAGKLRGPTRTTTGPYAEQFRQLMRMLSDAASKSGYRTETYDSSDDLDRPVRHGAPPAFR